MPINLERLERFYRLLIALCLALALNGCARNQPDSLTADIAGIRAIDNHAHPVRVTGAGDQDREFDALPVDNMEPGSDPVYLRPGAPGVAEAATALYAALSKPRTIQDKGDGYPAWVLDQMGVDVMLANRVQMGRGIQPPRFRWVPYADALLFPLDNAHLAAANSDRKAFFADEDTLLHRYLKDAAWTNI